MDCTLDEEEISLARLAQRRFKDGLLVQIIDPIIKEEVSSDSLGAFVKVAIQCIHSGPKHRPSMAEVVVGLKSALTLQEKSTEYYLPEIDISEIQVENENFEMEYKDIPSSRRQNKQSSAVKRFVAFLTLKAPALTGKLNIIKIDTIEDFLQGQNSLMPIRYSYSQIKKFTKGFKDILGQGGFGTVYKGRLRSGGLVAVKILSNYMASGQTFMSEVGTIGRIHHVNIVRLVGFCVEGSKRALLYEYMPNGSLDKHIFGDGNGDVNEGGTAALSREKIYEISCKVARGIEYLHHGCDMQILHFNIKLRSILLDDNFNPKISSFCLAKLFATDDSNVTITTARGKMGYLAPELFYRNVGGVSNKVDVYNFGMLLLEMAGKRKNLTPLTDQMSQIYYPSWIYDQVSKGKEIKMKDATDNEKELVKKMIIVAMWCIQMKPTERPSMKEVINMFEWDLELLSMPPKPLICPEEALAEDAEFTPSSSY